MIADQNRIIAERAKAIYAGGLGQRLEAEHLNRLIVDYLSVQVSIG